MDRTEAIRHRKSGKEAAGEAGASRQALQGKQDLVRPVHKRCVCVEAGESLKIDEKRRFQPQI